MLRSRKKLAGPMALALRLALGFSILDAQQNRETLDGFFWTRGRKFERHD